VVAEVGRRRAAEAAAALVEGEECGGGGRMLPVAVEAGGWVGAEVLEGAAGEAGYFFVVRMHWRRGSKVTFLGRSVHGAMATGRRSFRRWFRHFDARRRVRRSRGCRALSLRTAGVV